MGKVQEYTLAVGPVLAEVGDDFYRYRVCAAEFVGPARSAVQGPECCIIECARLAGGRPWRVAVKPSCLPEVVKGMMRYLDLARLPAAELEPARATEDLA